MNEISTKKLILCSMVGTLLAGLMLIILQVVIALTLFFLGIFGYLPANQVQTILGYLPLTKTVPYTPLHPAIDKGYQPLQSTPQTPPSPTTNP
jgi:riboflavin transporter FmnP